MTRRTTVYVKQGLLSIMDPPVMLSVKASDMKRAEEERILVEAAEITAARHLSSQDSENNENSTTKATDQKGETGLSGTNSVFSLSSSLETTSFSSCVSYDASWVIEEHPGHHFARDVRLYTGGVAYIPAFDSGLRKVMEPHLRRARLWREQSRHRTSTPVAASIAGSLGVPYTQLRRERPFLFDEYTFPLHQILAETLHVQDLSQVHQLTLQQQDVLLQPLLDREQRHDFHQNYDSFVTSFCIPLLHSLAIEKNVFHMAASADRITYRYQAFPNITIARPGEATSEPNCLTSKGHSIAYLTFHIPLTPTMGTSALYTESHPGREDWHPMAAKSFGLGYLYDGARCLSFGLENTTDTTRVSLDFCVAMYSEHDDGLVLPSVLQDNFSNGYYDEAVMDLGQTTTSCCPEEFVRKKNGRGILLDPDYRVGSPFG